MRVLRQISCAALALSLMACGGDGGDNTKGLASVSGVAIDGNLFKANVFLDLNGDGLLTTGEPTATTDEVGGFTIFATPEQLEKHRVVVRAVAGTTIDQDYPNTVLTSGFTLLAPAGNPWVVSPLTTQVVAKMDAGLSLESAKAAIQVELGLAAIDPMKNYVALKQFDAEYAKAHNVAAAIAEVLKTIETDPGIDGKLSNKLAALSSKVSTELAPNVESIKSAASLLQAVQVVSAKKSSSSDDRSILSIIKNAVFFTNSVSILNQP